MRAGDVIAMIEEVAPPRLAASWDASGWQIGDPERPVRGALLSLDLTADILTEAIAVGANLIVTHHPLFFRPLPRIDLRDPLGRLVAGLIRAEVLVYAAHTNLDLAPEGVNAALADRFDLRTPEPLEPVGSLTTPAGEQAIGWGMVGELPRELTTAELGELAADRLGTGVVRIVGRASDRHRRLAVCGGSGSDFIRRAASVATVYLTSDVRYHQAQEAESLGLSVIDVGHYYSERPVLDRLAMLLRRNLAVPVAISAVRTSPFAEWIR